MIDEIKLLNPSCSELVTFLDITEPEEIRIVLKEICKRFDYKVKLIPSTYDPIKMPGIEIEIDKLDVNKDVKVLTFGDILIDFMGLSLEEAYENNIVTYEYYLKHKDDGQKLIDLISFLTGINIEGYHYMKLVLMDSDNTYVEIAYQLSPGYNEAPGLSLQASQHCITTEYPILGNIFLMNPGKFKYYSFDEGSTKDFEEWLGVKLTCPPEDLEVWLKNKNYVEYKIKDFSFKSDENQ